MHLLPGWARLDCLRTQTRRGERSGVAVLRVAVGPATSRSRRPPPLGLRSTALYSHEHQPSSQTASWTKYQLSPLLSICNCESDPKPRLFPVYFPPHLPRSLHAPACAAHARRLASDHGGGNQGHFCRHNSQFSGEAARRMPPSNTGLQREVFRHRAVLEGRSPVTNRRRRLLRSSQAILGLWHSEHDPDIG